MYEPTILTLPEHWACPLLYGDVSGLDDQEEAALDSFLADHPNLFLADVDDAPKFCHRHDATPYGVLACQCYLFTFLPTEEEDDHV